MPGCPIRIPADQIVCADPRSFSQLIASFIASESLGIPHTPLSSLSPDLLFALPVPRQRYRKLYLYFTYSLVFLFQCAQRPESYLRTLSQYVNERFSNLKMW